MNKIENFIKRRFPINCDWMEGNCYYFARILQMRFSGEIWYDIIDGHFLFYKDGTFYDWTGIRDEYELNKTDGLVKWPEYAEIDSAHFQRIVRDVIE